jgi:hypothetical protein
LDKQFEALRLCGVERALEINSSCTIGHERADLSPVAVQVVNGVRLKI